jgi:hypothetical protein
VEKRCVPFNWRPDSHTTISGLVELGIGIVRLSAAGESRTADGVGIGSTYDDLEGTYPDGEGDGIGFRADMPHTDRYYRFEANRDGVVSSVMLAFHGTSCAG